MKLSGFLPYTHHCILIICIILFTLFIGVSIRPVETFQATDVTKAVARRERAVEIEEERLKKEREQLEKNKSEVTEQKQIIKSKGKVADAKQSNAQRIQNENADVANDLEVSQLNEEQLRDTARKQASEIKNLKYDNADYKRDLANKTKQHDNFVKEQFPKVKQQVQSGQLLFNNTVDQMKQETDNLKEEVKIWKSRNKELVSAIDNAKSTFR